jgi:acyl-CoA synthetase (AMP-forming)/AMP-acid ligase II
VTLPAAAASLAWLDAKFQLSRDIWAISSTLGHTAAITKLEKQDRVNMFYNLEELAQNPKSGRRLFVVVPKDASRPYAKTEWTYAEAYKVVLKYARWLQETHRIQKNEVVAMDFKNKPQFMWVWFALWSLGAIPAFINSNLRDTAFIHCVKTARARVLILDSDLQEVLTEDARKQLAADERGHATEVDVLDAYTESRIAQLEPLRASDQARSGALISTPAMLIYTSGTTGLPKAANVNWGKPVAGSRFFASLNGLTSTDRYYTAMPLYHSSASLLGACQVLGPGCTLVISPKFSARTQMKELTETKATVMQYVGEMCRYLVNTPPTPYDRAHSVRVVFGNGMRPDVWPRFKERFNIPTVSEFYGATEGPSATYNVSNNSFSQGAIGGGGWLLDKLFGGRQVLLKYDVENDTPWRDPTTGFCKLVDRGGIGELVYPLEADNIEDRFQGYYGNEKASQSKILRNVLAKGDVFYRTGDLQRRDHNGYWWFVDRIGDTFRWKGENVSTAEVSEVLGVHPALHEANVYGVELPNHDGRAGCAAVSLGDGKALDDQTATSLAQHARKRLPKYAVPIFLRVLKEMEVTGTMKHQKVNLRKDGVDPSKTGSDEIFWLPPGESKYVRFGKSDWEKIAGGKARL